MSGPTDLAQLYILLSYEKLQRSTISQRQRPTEASLRNRLLVWRFLKKIENEPVSLTHYSDSNVETNSNENENNSWILDLNGHCPTDEEIQMDIDSSDLVTVVTNHEMNGNSYDTMDIEEENDVTLILKRAIGAERRQKSPSTENFLTLNNDDDVDQQTNHQDLPTNNSYEETEQFFHDLCAELTSTTATLVSSCPIAGEQALIH